MQGGGGGGAKIKKLFEKKKVKAFLQVKINCIKLVLKSHISMIQLFKMNKTVVHLMRGFRRGVKTVLNGRNVYEM